MFGIVCFDAKFAEWYESHGGLCAQNDRRGQEIQDINGPYGSFKVRSSVVAGLLERGYDVLLSDTDAIWKRNPLWYLRPHHIADVIISRGMYPPDFSKVFGSSGCMGFSFFPGNSKRRIVLQEIYCREDRRPAKLWKRTLEGRKRGGFELGTNGKMKFKLSSVISYARYSVDDIAFSIAFLPEMIFTRECSRKSMTSPRSRRCPPPLAPPWKPEDKSEPESGSIQATCASHRLGEGR